MAEPKLRFKRDDGSDYPEWGKKSFKDSFIALNNNSFSRDMLNFDNGIVKNIHYGDILIKFGDICNIGKDIIPFVNSEYNTEKYDLLKDGDIILADTAEDEAVGKTIEIFNVRNNKVISGLHTIACRPITKYASKYLGYYMNSPSFHDQLRPFMQGIKVTSIGRKNISEVQICSPKVIDEQQKIAVFLSAVDEVIAESEKEVTNLDTQKKSVMKKIFSQEIRFKRNDGMDFPEWKNKTLGDLEGKVSSGKDKNENGCVPLYGSMGPIGTCSEATHLGNKILVARVGANAGAVRLVVEDCGVTDNTLIIKDTESCDFFWLYYALVEKDIGKMRFGGGQPLVTGTMLFTLEIEVP